MPQRVRSVVYGAMGGALLSLVGLAVFGSRASLRSVQGVLLDPAAGRGRSDFIISSGGLYMAVIILAVLGSLVIAGAVYAFGSREMGERRFPLRFLLPTAGVTAAIMAYAMLRAGLGAVATIELGTVTVSVFRLIIVSMIAGTVAGGAIASVVDALARPSFLGFEGDAVPRSSSAFMREAVSDESAGLRLLVELAPDRVFGALSAAAMADESMRMQSLLLDTMPRTMQDSLYRIELDELLDIARVATVIVLIALPNHPLAFFPGYQSVGAIADQVAGFCPGLAALLNDMLRNG